MLRIVTVGVGHGACRRKELLNEESIACKPKHFRKLLILRSPKSISDRLHARPNAGANLILLACTAASLYAQNPIFPDQIGAYQKSAPKTIGIPDQALFEEYGLEATEAADYTAPDKKRFTA